MDNNATATPLVGDPGVPQKLSGRTSPPPSGTEDGGQGFNSGHKEDPLKTTLYRTLRFQSFLREFQDPDVRTAFLAGHFSVEDSTEKMLHCIDKILELILPSLR